MANVTLSVVGPSAGVGEFATIGAALAFAAANHGSDEVTITIAAGTYTENLSITQANISLVGANAGIAADGVRGAETIIDGYMVVTGNGTGIDGITLANGGNVWGTNAGIVLQATGVSIANSVFSGSGQTHIAIEMAPNSTGFSVSGSSFDGWASGIWVNPGATGLSVTGNTFSNNGNGMNIDGPGVTGDVSGNSFVSSVGSHIGMGLWSAGTIDASALIGSNTFNGPNAQVSLYGTGGADVLIGTEGPNRLFGGDGNDMIHAGPGDSVYGGGGNDELVVDAGMTPAQVLAMTIEGVEKVSIDNGGGGATTWIVLEGQSIQAAIDAASAGDTILVGDGTFTENVLINKSSITIVSMNGRDATTIVGIEGAGRLGAVQFAPGVTGVTLGDTDQGFTVIGFDSANPGLEVAAVYFQGAQSGHTIRGNDIRANGDGGMVSEVDNNSNITIDGNIFSGQTFVGPNPAGNGFGDLFTLFNVPRQLVAINSGAGSTGIVFTNNQVTGTAGGINGANQPQGNTLVTIDVPNSTISDNEFTGFTNRFATQLRARGNGTEITDNTFDQPDGGNSGIFTDTATGQTISGNEFNLNDAGNLFAGTGGADVIFGNGGTDSISGGAGNDTIDGGNDNDVLLGDAGADSLSGGDGNDTLYGGDGDDIIEGGAGADVLYGGNGNDLIRADLDDVVDGGAGTNTVVFAAGTDPDDIFAMTTLSNVQLIVIEGTANTLYVAEGMSIQAAIDAANPGDTIIVGPGTFAEALSINKEIHIVGAGSGSDPATATIIDPPVDTSFGVTFFGLSDGSSLSSVRVTGGATGISLEDGTGDLTFTDVAAVGNSLYGLNYRTGTGQTVGEVTVIDSVFSDNGSVGLRLASGGSHAHLSVSGSTFSGNGVSGLSTQGNTLASISVLDSAFANNGTAGGSGHGDLILFSFTGDAVLQNLTISNDGRGSNALQITGITSGSGAEPDPRKAVVPVGTVEVDGVTITGTYARDVVQIGRFTDLNGLSISGVEVQATQGAAPGWAQVSFFNVGGDVDLAAYGLANGLRTNISTNNGVDFASAPDATTGAALTGGSGNDGLVGHVLNDTLAGGDGNDTLSGGAGNDNLNGGAGDDLILADAGNDTIDGGDGIDTLDMAAAGSGGSFVDLNAGLAFSSATGIDTVSRVENLRGSSGDDGLFGDDNDNTFFASGGSDVIDGRGGSDTFDASAAGTAMTVNLATGVVSGAHAATLMSVENVRTGAGNDVITGSAADNRIETGAGNDTIIASGGNDTVDGGAGMDTVSFAGNRADYTITWDGTTATVSGGGGTVTITNAGRLDFADKDVLLVDDGSAEFATIGAAITAAVDGDEILVAAGTYAETLAINKGISIFGANAGLAGSDAGRGAEAIIDGTVTIGAASAVTIDGMKFLNNDALPRAKVDTIFVTTAAGHVITNTVFESTVAGGSVNDQAIYTTVLTSGALSITNNLFTGDSSFGTGDKYATAAWGRGIWSNVNGATLVISDNDFQNTRTGITLEGYNDASSTVSGNSFLNAGTGISVGIPSAGTFAGITGNSFANTDTDLNLQNLTANLTIDVGGTTNSAPDVMVVLGGAGNDAITGTDGADAISGRGGNDTITGGAGDDSINGEGGNDTVVLSGNATDYTWTGTAAAFVITDGRAGSPDGTDTVANVEFVQFADITLSTTALFANVKLYDVDGNLLGGFATIQEAVNAATGGIGEKIEVAAGAYAETVTVNKSVAIHGANAGVAHDGTRGAESVLNGLFVLAADGVTIDGFSVNGGGTQGSGVRGSGSFVADDITIANTLFTGQTGQPILYGFGQGGAGATNWTVTGNKVSGITGANATAMVFFNIDGLTVSDNLIEHDDTGLAGRRGINLDGITNGTISGNTLSFGGVANTSWGIQISMSDGVAGPLAITGNTVSDVASAISLLSQRSASGLDITGNTLSGTNGVVMNNGSAAPVVPGVTMSDIEVTGNTITVTGFAVRLRDLHNGAANGPVVFAGVDVSGNTIVSGTLQAGGNETLAGGGQLLNVAGANILEGTSGNDVVLAEGSGTVAFTGGAGDDLMIFGAGGGSFDGGAGSDTADFSNIASSVVVELTNGNVSSGITATLTGVENVIGSAFDDILHGDGNANLLQGGDGNDTIAASGGDDTMDGGNGTDTATFSASTAAVFANLVLNTAFGAEVGNNVLVSIENLTGGAGNDALVGNDGNNRLDGGAGNDTLTGGGGDDILVAGTGLDVVFGGSGNDTAVFAGDWAGFDITESGGVFTISRDGNVATVSEVENFIFNGVDYLASEIVNSAPDDILFTDGAPSVDENADGAAITRLDATDPNPGDTVTLTVDDSRFEIVAAVGPGLPWLLKLKAGETLNFETEASVTLNIAATDSKGATRVEHLVITVNDVNEPPEPGPGLGTWTPNPIEAGSVGAQLFPEAGFTDPDGDALTYELLSAPSLGRLLLNGGQVKVGDILSQADLEAMVYNSPAPDGLYTATFAVSDGEFIQPLTLNLNVTAAVDAVYNGTAGNNTLDGALGRDTVFGRGGDDLLYGGGSNDQLFGGDGRDTLYGGFGFDTLGGGNGNDLLFGGAGNDRLIGGSGNDTATGGDGADTFVLFNVASDIGKFARMNITDFTSGEDKIDLRVFSGLTYIGAAAFNGAGGQVRYVAAQDQLVIDWNADSVADYRIQLQTGAAFAVGDLLL